MKQVFRAVLTVIALLSLLATPVLAGPPVTDDLDVHEFAASGFIPDASATAELKRYNNKVKIKIQTNNLDPGAVYTVWAVVWNDPDVCSDPCGMDDIGAPGNSIFWVTGKVINSQGNATFNGMIFENSPPGPVNFGPGLTSAADAELHFIMRSHGQPIPGMVDEQKSTLDGGCDINVCADHQAAGPP